MQTKAISSDNSHNCSPCYGLYPRICTYDIYDKAHQSERICYEPRRKSSSLTRTAIVSAEEKQFAQTTVPQNAG